MRALGIIAGIVLWSGGALAQSWAPTPAMVASFRAELGEIATRSAAGAFAALYRDAHPSLQAQMSEVAFVAFRTAQGEDVGWRSEWVFTNVVWYPPQPGRPAIGVAEYHARTSAGGLGCGYLALVALAEDELQLARDEVTHLSAYLITNNPDGAQAAVAHLPGCADLPLDWSLARGDGVRTLEI